MKNEPHQQKRSDFKRIHNYIADLLNNNKVFRINDNEVITSIPANHFISDMSNYKLNTRDDDKIFFRKNLS